MNMQSIQDRYLDMFGRLASRLAVRAAFSGVFLQLTFSNAHAAAGDNSLSATEFLILATGYIGVTIVSLFAVAVLFQIFQGKIDLSKLISEADGSASMSRFQLMIFTFVIGFGIVLLTIESIGCDGIPNFPKIPPTVMALLGISGGTYAISKGIQKSNEKSEKAGSQEAETLPGRRSL